MLQLSLSNMLHYNSVTRGVLSFSAVTAVITVNMKEKALMVCTLGNIMSFFLHLLVIILFCSSWSTNGAVSLCVFLPSISTVCVKEGLYCKVSNCTLQQQLQNEYGGCVF